MDKIYETKHYSIVVDKEDKEGLWYHLVNNENGLVEDKQSLKPQALIYCEQYSILVEQEMHKEIAKNMVNGMAAEALDVYAYGQVEH